MELTHDPITEEEIRAVFANSFPRCSGKQRKDAKEYSVTAQLLLLYYVLLYEDTRLTQVKSYLQAGLNIRAYSQSFFAELPIRYLISQAEKQQHLYAGKRKSITPFISFFIYNRDSLGLFPPLLRLLATHFPQLCLVDDWMYEASDSPLSALRTSQGFDTCSSQAVNRGTEFVTLPCTLRFNVVCCSIR